MTETKFNTEIAKRVRAKIVAEPESLDMSTWGQKTECGTTACVAGWTVLLSDPDVAKIMDEAEIPNEPDLDGVHAVDLSEAVSCVPAIAAGTLGIDGAQAVHLFYAHTDAVLPMLDLLIETEGRCTWHELDAIDRAFSK